jgi:hypothetical protein
VYVVVNVVHGIADDDLAEEEDDLRPEREREQLRR